jgi:hypothetical protein
MSFVHTWVWPAGGSGGIWGDVVGSFLWVIFAGIVTIVVYPPIREAVKRWMAGHTAEVKAHISSEQRKIHQKLDRHEKLQHHIILNSRSIPNEVPGIADEHQPKK